MDCGGNIMLMLMLVHGVHGGPTKRVRHDDHDDTREMQAAQQDEDGGRRISYRWRASERDFPTSCHSSCLM